MVKLKTLKDLEITIEDQLDGDSLSGLHDVALIGDLKQEAIKWVKNFDSDKYFETMDNTWSTPDPREVSGFIKHFFNITAEDLNG